jgi:hypothetical protein
MTMMGALDPRNLELIRPEIRESLLRYATDGVPVGGFLQAVIANDLVDAVARASLDNILALPAIAVFVRNELAGMCWGSRRIYRAWVEWHASRRLGPPEREAAAKEEIESAHRESRSWS